MATERWKRIEELFGVALGLPPPQRGSFLIQECGEDTDLRLQIEVLLEHDARVRDDFLGEDSSRISIRGLSQTNEPDPIVGKSIGAFKVMSVIAHGGMGTVYLAEQANPRRNVALKILRLSLGSHSAERRFDVESRILAYLRHPNIANVHEAGTWQLATGVAVRYYAMEYVPDSSNLTRFAGESSLSLRDRLQLFLQLCDAVHHGHQKGVVHRDLKPANILVDREGRVKIIDFGIARLTDSDISKTTMHTEVGHFLGTLAYMSPEQCMADPSQIDTTSDIYSLGVILFELLTGRMPYDVSNMPIQAAARVICEQEPARPSQYKKELRGDAETMILKAIEKNAQKRYTSAAALAEDVRQYLRGDPISTRPPTTWALMLRWAGRSPRLAVVLTSVVIALIIVGATGLSVQIANSRPYRIELTRAGKIHEGFWGLPVKSGDRAALYSRMNSVLHDWSSTDSDGIRLAKMLDRPAMWGGGRVLVLGFAQSAESEYRRRICLFRADGGYDKPIWSHTIEKECIDKLAHDAWPRPHFDKGRQYNSSGFSLTRAWVIDVFASDDHPGPEIIVFHQHDSGSQGALRIYNLNGETLFHVWHDGNIFDVQWMANAGVLVCAAIKADEDEQINEWKLVGRHPRVLFAIRPTPREISDGWIYPRKPTQWNGNWYQPVWYRVPWPVKMADSGSCNIEFISQQSIPLRTESEELIQVEFTFPAIAVANRPYNLSVLIDRDGKVHESPTQDDVSRRARIENTNLPNPDEFQLRDWNDVISPSHMSTSRPSVPHANSE